MEVLEFVEKFSPFVSASATVLLVVITGIYAYLTRKILKATLRHSNLALNPVIGIQVRKIAISTVFGPDRRNMGVELDLTNVGNAPAIEVFVDGEIILERSRIKNENSIPARFEAQVIPFIRPGQDVEDHSLSFGNTLLTHLFDDFRESERLNIHRIETEPSREPYTASRLKVFIHYKNSLDQHFISTYEARLGMYEPEKGFKLKVPGPKETGELILLNIPRPSFHAGPTTQEDNTSQMAIRDSKRDLCGW